MKVDTHPKICNICGGEVEFVENTKIYGNYLKYGKKSGWCYHCKKCGAVVGTHIKNPTEALGLLANKEMADARQKAHAMFDKFWKNKKQRTEAYQKLAIEMGVPEEECHFAYFDLEQLKKSYQILLRWWREKYDR